MRIAMVIVVIIAVAGLSLWGAYSQVHESEFGLIYDPKENRVYSVVLGPSLYKREIYVNILPASSPSFLDVQAIIDDLGTIDDIISDNQKPFSTSDINTAVTDDILNSDFSEAAFFFDGNNFKVEDLLPDAWASLMDDPNMEKLDIFTGHSVIHRSSMNQELYTFRSDLLPKIISPTILLGPRASSIVHTHCLSCIGENCWMACRLGGE